jgi:hypothetical protein
LRQQRCPQPSRLPLAYGIRTVTVVGPRRACPRSPRRARTGVRICDSGVVGLATSGDAGDVSLAEEGRCGC